MQVVINPSNCSNTKCNTTIHFISEHVVSILSVVLPYTIAVVSVTRFKRCDDSIVLITRRREGCGNVGILMNSELARFISLMYIAVISRFKTWVWISKLCAEILLLWFRAKSSSLGKVYRNVYLCWNLSSSPLLLSEFSHWWGWLFHKGECQVACVEALFLPVFFPLGSVPWQTGIVHYRLNVKVT